MNLLLKMMGMLISTGVGGANNLSGNSLFSSLALTRYVAHPRYGIAQLSLRLHRNSSSKQCGIRRCVYTATAMMQAEFESRRRMCTQRRLMNVCWCLKGGCIRGLDAWPQGLVWLAPCQRATLMSWLSCFCWFCFCFCSFFFLLFVLQILFFSKHCFNCGKMKNRRIRWRVKGEQMTVSKSNQPLCLPDLLPPVERKNVKHMIDCFFFI